MVKKKRVLRFVKANIEQGTHIVMLYETESDILTIFPSFFAEGLENNEFCIMVYPTIRLKEKLKKEIAKLVDLKKYINEKKIEFIHFKKFYFKNNIFTKEKVYNLIDKKLNHIGFKDVDGVRTAGDMTWVNNKFFKKVIVYEKGLTEKYGKMSLLLMCAYPVKKISVTDLIETIQSHNLILYKIGNKWRLSEPIERKILKEDITDLTKFTKFAAHREMKMVELKKRITELEMQLKTKIKP